MLFNLNIRRGCVRSTVAVSRITCLGSTTAFLFITQLALVPVTLAMPYKGSNVSACFAEKGKLDLPCVGAALDALATVASNWPPKTDSDDDKKRAATDVKALHEGMLTGLKSVSDSKDLFLKLAWSAHMGHNLDVPGMAQRADSLYKQFVTLYPQDVKGNFLYGSFLGAANGHQKAAIPYLEKALSLGEKRAAYVLAQTYLIADDKTNAKKYIQEYLATSPSDEQAKKLLETIEKGNSLLITAPEAK